MKKPKISLDKDKLQAFFLNHVEKILLGIIVGLMFLLIWRGFSLPHLDGSMSPQGLISKSESTKQYVDDPQRWTEVALQPPRTVDLDVVRKVQDVQTKTNPLAYLLPNALNRPDFPKLSPREDPELFAPINLVVKAVVGPLASFLKPSESEYVDPLYPQTADSDDPLKRAMAKKKALADAKKKAAEMSGGYGPGGEDGGMPGPRGKKKGGRRGTGDDAGSGSEYGGRGGRGGMPGGPGGSDGGYGGGYGGMLGGSGMAGGLYPESAMIGYAPQNPEATVARDVASVTVMAVVPIQKQNEEFEKKLANSLDYNPQRDAPWYLDYRIQRVDVTELDPAAPIDEKAWQAMPAPKNMLIELMGDVQNPNSVGLYAGAPMDVADPNYLDYEVLTHPAPPYLQRDLWDLLTHPDVPLATVGLQYGEGMPGVAGAGTPAAAAGGDDAPSMPVGRLPGAMQGGGESDGGYGGGMRGGYGGMRGGYGGMPGSEGGMSMPGGGGMRGGYGGMRGGYGGMRGGEDGGDGGYGSGYGAGSVNYTPPKYKLVRFTDTRVERGRKYRYRIRLYLHDPNHPMLGVVAPSAASLHGDVQKRVKALDDADAKKPKDKTTGMPARTAWVLTPWSEPSPIAELPPAARVFAGKVKPERFTKIRQIDVPMAEPEADALAVVFDPTKVADIPAENQKVSRGSVLNFETKDVKVIHPVTKEVIDMPKYNVTTNALVADLMGGESIKAINASATATALTTMGELLVVDAHGKLRVQNESDDIENFRRFTVPKEDPKAAAAAAGSADGGMALPGEGGARPRGRGARGSDF